MPGDPRRGWAGAVQASGDHLVEQREIIRATDAGVFNRTPGGVLGVREAAARDRSNDTSGGASSVPEAEMSGTNVSGLGG